MQDPLYKIIKTLLKSISYDMLHDSISLKSNIESMLLYYTLDDIFFN